MDSVKSDTGYKPITRASKRISAYDRVHTAMVQGKSFTEALKEAHTTKKTFEKGRRLYHKQYTGIAKVKKNPQTHRYELPQKEPKEKGPPTFGAGGKGKDYSKKLASAENWMEKQDLEGITDQTTLESFIYQKFNSGFAPMVFDHLKGNYPE